MTDKPINKCIMTDGPINKCSMTDGPINKCSNDRWTYKPVLQ